MAKGTTDYVKAIEGGVQPTQVIETKIYKKRWLVLGIFVLYSASNAMQWLQYSIISNIIERYYNVSQSIVNYTSMIYMVTYVPFIFPASYILDKLGLRYSVIIGAVGTAIGSWIKIFSVNPDLFWVTFIGHTIVALSQTFILSVPARLAAVWFGPDQVSSACSIGVFGNQLGVAIGFLFPPMLVPDSKDNNEISEGLQLMFYIVAGSTTVILILILLFFSSQPPLPPSPAQAVQREIEESENFALSVKRLLSNTGYLLLLLSYATNVGIFYAISTMLNSIIAKHFENSTIDAGRIGLFIVCAGMLGSVMCGIILDKFHKFKETTLAIYVFSLVGLVIFTVTLGLVSSILWVYLTAGVLGFFMTGYLPVGFEFAAELTYPEPEGTSAGLLNAMVQIFGVALIFIYERIFDAYDDFWANIVMCIVLLIGAILTFIIPNDLRRQNAKF